MRTLVAVTYLFIPLPMPRFQYLMHLEAGSYHHCDIGSGVLNNPTETSFKIGLIGKGIQLSRTPFMHETEARRLGLTFKYDLIDTDLMGETPPPVSQILNMLEEQGYTGANITFPFKQTAMEFIDEFSDAAIGVGSVNTVLFRDGKRFGHNTDVSGFEQSYRENMMDQPKKSVLLIGAGGAGVSVAHALLKCGVGKLFVADTNHTMADKLVSRLNSQFGGTANVISVEVFPEISNSLDGVVNATPIGMAKLPGSPFPEKLIQQKMWIVDIVYFPLETELLNTARAIGCHTLSGAEMAVFQALHAFELFTGISADAAAMKSSFAAFENR